MQCATWWLFSQRRSNWWLRSTLRRWLRPLPSLHFLSSPCVYMCVNLLAPPPLQQSELSTSSSTGEERFGPVQQRRRATASLEKQIQQKKQQLQEVRKEGGVRVGGVGPGGRASAVTTPRSHSSCSRDTMKRRRPATRPRGAWQRSEVSGQQDDDPDTVCVSVCVFLCVCAGRTAL